MLNCSFGGWTKVGWHLATAAANRSVPQTGASSPNLGHLGGGLAGSGGGSAEGYHGEYFTWIEWVCFLFWRTI